MRFIDAFVDELDMHKLEFTHSQTCLTGRKPYDPRDMLKLYIYGYFNQIRSSRKLEKETNRNIEVIWLLKKLQPDFKTIADFRKDKKGIKKGISSVCNDLQKFGSFWAGFGSNRC